MVERDKAQNRKDKKPIASGSVKKPSGNESNDRQRAPSLLVEGKRMNLMVDSRNRKIERKKEKTVDREQQGKEKLNLLINRFELENILELEQVRIYIKFILDNFEKIRLYEMNLQNQLVQMSLERQKEEYAKLVEDLNRLNTAAGVVYRAGQEEQEEMDNRLLKNQRSSPYVKPSPYANPNDPRG